MKPRDTGRHRRLRFGVVPTLFKGNSFTALAAQPQVWTNEQPPYPDAVAVVNHDHDYCASADPAALSQAERERVPARWLEQAAISNKFGLERYCASDDNIKFYTSFASHAHLMAFWSHIEPDTYKLMRKGARAVNRADQFHRTVAGTSLPLIDEFFLFMIYLSLGLTLEDLADMFRIPQSAVISTINTWANFLYSILGVMEIWQSEAEIKAQLPHVFNSYSDTQVVLVCTEMHCQSLKSLFLKSEVLPTYKSYCSFKGLIGLAPHGAVTFVSALYAHSISDKELLKQSGIASLLKPTMAIMVDKGFHVKHCVPCKIYIPAQMSKRSQQSVPKVRKAQSVPSLRVHIKKLIQRVKEHKILSTVIPLSLSCSINQLYTVSCLLFNYQNFLSGKGVQILEPQDQILPD